MDLFGLMNTSSLNGKYYVFIIVDDFSRFTWTLFLAHKRYAFGSFSHFYKRVEKYFRHSIIKIRSDHGGEFENKNFDKFCIKHDIKHSFSA